jgi:hypothetical protein
MYMSVAGAARNDWNPDLGYHSQLLAPGTHDCNGLPLL